MPLLKNSLRNKVVLVLLLPTALTMLLLGVILFFTARATLEEELGRRLVSIGQTLSADLSHGVEAAQLERLDATKARTRARLTERLESVRATTGVRRLFLIDPAFKSLIDTDTQIPFHQRLFEVEADRFEISTLLDSHRPAQSVLFRGEDGTLYKTAYVPVLLYPEDEESGERDMRATPRVVAILGVVASASFFDLLERLVSSLLLVALLGAAFAILIGILFARRLTRPLSSLVEAARRLEHGQLDTPVISAAQLERASTRGDELDSLALSFEEMRLAVLDRDRQMQMMLSGIAHEVRNPLGGMELFCGLLREDLEFEEREDDLRLDKVRRIERELGYLNRVVTDFLDFARHRPLTPERFPAIDLLSELQMLLCAEAEEAGCAIEVHVEPRDLELTADRDHLRRAIINATRNAWQASPEGGAIVLSASAPSESERLLTVRDHGVGIPPEKLEEILTPFYTTKEKGSGLGLALTGKIIAQHGGSLQIESAPGEGTTLCFHLPFDPSLQPAEAAIPEGWLG